MSKHKDKGKITPKQARKLRDTQRWRILRLKIIKRDNGECFDCKQHDRIAPRHSQLEVDHIVAIKDGGDFWDESNLRTLCKACHNDKSTLERRTKRPGVKFCIHGYARSGNSAWACPICALNLNPD